MVERMLIVAIVFLCVVEVAVIAAYCLYKVVIRDNEVVEARLDVALLLGAVEDIAELVGAVPP